MASTTENYREFEKMGEKKVRENLALNLFNPNKEAAARLWLDQRSAFLSIRRDSHKQTLQIIAAIAATVAAIAAIISATASIIQLLAK